jgi:hypothetical protein
MEGSEGYRVSGMRMQTRPNRFRSTGVSDGRAIMMVFDKFNLKMTIRTNVLCATTEIITGMIIRVSMVEKMSKIFLEIVTH